MRFRFGIPDKEIEERIRTGDPRSVADALSRSERWRGNAAPLIHDNPRQRECIDLILPLLDSSSDGVRRNVLQALAGIAWNNPMDSRALPSVVAALRDRLPEIRECAAEVLAYWPDAMMGENLLAAIGDPNPRVPGHCIRALANLDDMRALARIEQVVEAGSSWGWYWSSPQFEALERLFPAQRLTKLYLSMIDHGDYLAGLRGLERMVQNAALRPFTPPALSTLFKLLRNPSLDSTWASPERVIAAMQTTETADAVLDHLEQEQEERVRQSLLRIMVELRPSDHPRLNSARYALLTDSNAAVDLRLKAAKQLTESKQPGLWQALISMLQEPNLCNHPNHAAAHEIGALIGAQGLYAPLEPLLQLLKSSSLSIKRGVIVALGNFVDHRAVSALLALLREGPHHVSEVGQEVVNSIARIYQESETSVEIRSMIEANMDLLVWQGHTIRDFLLEQSRSERSRALTNLCIRAKDDLAALQELVRRVQLQELEVLGHLWTAQTLMEIMESHVATPEQKQLVWTLKDTVVSIARHELTDEEFWEAKRQGRAMHESEERLPGYSEPFYYDHDGYRHSATYTVYGETRHLTLSEYIEDWHRRTRPRT